MNWLTKRALQSVAWSVPLLFSTNLFAQGCASCYTTAAAGGLQTAHALRAGILVLAFPPTLIFVGIIFTLQRWKNADRKMSNPAGQLRLSASEEIE